MPIGNGGIIGLANVPTLLSAKGVWSLREAQLAQRQGAWPLVDTSDPYFEYTTLLLPGNGTNGANNNTFLDSSTNNFTITRNGNTTQGTFSPFSQTGWGNYFNGSSSISTVDSSDFAFGSSDFTVQGWLFSTATGALQWIAGQGNSSAANSSISFAIQKTSGNKINCSVFTGSTQYQLTSTNDLTANQWVHIAFVRDVNTCRLYIGGNQDGTVSVTGVSVNDSANQLSIGQLGEYVTNRYTGYVSNFSIIKGTCLYPNGTAFNVPTTPLSTSTSNQVLLTCQANRFIDSNTATTAKTITVNGSPSVQAFSPFSPTASWSAATNGGSGYFDGSGDYLTTSSTIIPSTGDFTIETWIYPTSLVVSTIVYMAGAGASTDFLFYYNSSGALGVETGNSYRETATGLIVANAWQHVALTKTGSTYKIFVNGTERTFTGSALASTLTQSTLNIGGLGASNNLAGYLSSLRIAQTLVYTSDFTPPTAPLTAITNTSLLLNYTNAGIYDATSKNDLETVGNAQISTTQSKFGGSSMAFDGTGDYLARFAANQLYNFSSGDWTIEAWVYRNASGSPHTILNLVNTLGSDSGLTFYVNSSNQLVTDNGTVAALAAGTVASGQWVHVAISRVSGTTTGYINGSSIGTTTQAPSAAQYAYIGSLASGVYQFNGYIQDLRVTKGYARYTANFTAPTAAFPTL